jgi:hypothetical protein
MYLYFELCLMFLRLKKSRGQRGHLLSCVIFTVGGSGLMNAQQMQYAMLASTLRLGTAW